jgi:hypothetical protein
MFRKEEDTSALFNQIVAFLSLATSTEIILFCRVAFSKTPGL